MGVTASRDLGVVLGEEAEGVGDGEEWVPIGATGEEVSNLGGEVIGELTERDFEADEGDTDKEAIRGIGGTTVDGEEVDPSNGSDLA